MERKFPIASLHISFSMKLMFSQELEDKQILSLKWHQRAWHPAKPYELTHAMLIPNQFFSIRYTGWAELRRRSRHRPTHVFGILYSKNFKILSIFSITKNFPFTVAYPSIIIVSAHPDVMNWKIPQKYMINSSFTP